MRNYKIDTRKKKLNYSLEFKYNNEVIKETIKPDTITERGYNYKW